MNDEKDRMGILEFIAVTIKYKFLITVIVLISSVSVVIVTLNMENIYVSKVVFAKTDNNNNTLERFTSGLGPLADLASSSFSAEKGVELYAVMAQIFTNQVFVENFILENNLESFFVKEYEEIKDQESYKSNRRYILYSGFRSHIFLTENKINGLYSITVMGPKRLRNKDVADLFILKLTEEMRRQEMYQLNERITEYKDELSRVDDITLKLKLTNVIVSLLQQKVMANTQKYYNIYVLQEAYIPDAADKVKPSRSLICIGVFFSSILFSYLFVIGVELSKSLVTQYRRKYSSE